MRLFINALVQFIDKLRSAVTVAPITYRLETIVPKDKLTIQICIDKQVPIQGWFRDHERQNLSISQRQEIALERQVKETRQEQLQQQAPAEQQQLNSRRKRSWSRAVFSNLQRKGLEKRFQLQKYITKPDRRQLAVSLGLTDAQVWRNYINNVI